MVAKKDAEEGALSRLPRQELKAGIEFIGDFDVISAQGVNISEGGICFDVLEGFLFEMKFPWKGAEQRRRARLVWVKRLEGSGYRFGFEFISEAPSPTLPTF